MLDAVASVIAPYGGWISLVFFISALIYWFGVSEFALTNHIPLPGPKSWPYVGNLLEVARYGGLHKAFIEYGKKYGKVYKMYLGRSPVITVADPEIMKHVLVKDFDKFRNRPEVLKGNAPLDKGLFDARDEAWKKVRSILTPTFSALKLKELVPLIGDAVDTLRRKLDDFAAKYDGSVDVSRLFGLFAFDVILRTALGVEAEIQTNPDPDLVQKALTLFDVPLYIRALSMFPFWQQMKKLFNINPIQHVPYFEKLGRSVLEIRKKSPSGRRDLFQLMLEASAKNSNNGFQKLTDDEIIGQSLIFLAAGSEKIASTLVVTAYYLARHPEIQAKIREEIAEATRSGEDASTYDFVNSLKYLDRVISEVLRITPIEFVTVRECNESCVIKGVQFPVGVTVNIPAYAVHHDPDFWPEPEKFDPDRFLQSEAKKRPSFSYMPFSLGPRQCIGMRLALLEIKMALVKILQRFKFERGVDTTDKLELNAALILRPRGPVKVKVAFVK
ncbi:hypothetical protein ACROYT_G024358 [Oculina patagonica]